MSWILSAFADEAGDELTNQVQTLNEAGYKYIDPRSIDGITITDLPTEHAKRAAEAFSDAGITVNMFGSPIGKIDLADDFDLDANRLRHLATLKDIFNCNKVRMFSYFNKKAQLDDAGWQQQALDRLQRLIDLAEQLDMVLYHENERSIYGDYLAPNVVICEKLRAPDNPHFRTIFDFANYQHAGEDCWDCWVATRDYVDAIHLKEARIHEDGHSDHVPVGTGTGDVKKILTDAAARGFDGSFTLEPHLAHSKAVMATGPSGAANQDFASMTPKECFLVAAKAAKDLFKELGKA